MHICLSQPRPPYLPPSPFVHFDHVHCTPTPSPTLNPVRTPLPHSRPAASLSLCGRVLISVHFCLYLPSFVWSSFCPITGHLNRTPRPPHTHTPHTLLSLSLSGVEGRTRRPRLRRDRLWYRYGNFDDVILAITHFSALRDLTRAVCHALRSAHAYRVLIGACNPMFYPFRRFRLQRRGRPAPGGPGRRWREPRRELAGGRILPEALSPPRAARVPAARSRQMTQTNHLGPRLPPRARRCIPISAKNYALVDCTGYYS